MQIENLTREEKVDFLSNPTWVMFREELFGRKQELYEGILKEDARVSEVKSKADKLSIIDEIFNVEKDIIQSLQVKGQ